MTEYKVIRPGRGKQSELTIVAHFDTSPEDDKELIQFIRMPGKIFRLSSGRDVVFRIKDGKNIVIHAYLYHPKVWVSD